MPLGMFVSAARLIAIVALVIAFHAAHSRFAGFR